MKTKTKDLQNIHYLPLAGRKVEITKLTQTEIKEIVETGGSHIFGCYNGPEREILIDEDQDPYEMTNSVIHEWLEAVNQIMDLGLDHRQISTISEMASQVAGEYNWITNNFGSA